MVKGLCILLAGVSGLGTSAWATTKVRSFSAGYGHTCAVLEDQTLKCWGNNSLGQLGLEDNRDRGGSPGEMGKSLPTVKLGSARTVLAVGCGDDFTCALLDNHSVKCWGKRGILGLGDDMNHGDSPGQMGDNLAPVNLGSGRTAVSLSVGSSHSCAILDDGSLKCWGLNVFGQLGLGDDLIRGKNPGEMGDSLPSVDLGSGRRAMSVTAGPSHTCAILDDQSLKCWGQNRSGQLGLGDQVSRGKLPNEMGNALPAVNLGAGRRVKSVTLSDQFMCAILENDAVKCWGANSRGQLGLEDTASRGSLPNQMGDHLPELNIEPGLGTQQVRCGFTSCCAVLSGGLLKCWGLSVFGEMGYGEQNSQYGNSRGTMGVSVPFVDVGKLRSVVSLAISDFKTCVILNDSGLRCWGQNIAGDLGQGDLTDRGDSSQTVPSMISPIDL